MAGRGNYDNTNSGAAFRNNQKKSQNHPDFTGSLNVNGQDFFLNIWEKTSKRGMPYFSISIKQKEVQQGRGQGQPVQNYGHPQQGHGQGQPVQNYGPPQGQPVQNYQQPAQQYQGDYDDTPF